MAVIANLNAPTALDYFVEVKIKTSPLQLPEDDPLYIELHDNIKERVTNIMDTWKVNSSYISGDGNAARNKSSCEGFSSALTEDLKIPIKVEGIYYSPCFNAGFPALAFFIEITDEIKQQHYKRDNVDLGDLIKEVFGS